MADMDQLSALMASTDIGTRPVNMKSGDKGEVLIALPRADDPLIWDALPPKEFIAKHGHVPIVEADLPHLLVLVKNQDGNHVPSPLFDKSMSGPDGKTLTDIQKKMMAESKLRELGVKIDLSPKKVPHGTWMDKSKQTYPSYKLEGEAQMFDTAGGLRMRQNEYREPMPTGALAPDMLLHDGTRGILVFRHKDDGIDSIRAMKEKHGYPHASLKSTGNFFHDETYINNNSSRWNTAEHRFKGYLQEGRIKDLDPVMVGMPNGRMFGAAFVMEHAPNSKEAQKLRDGPTDDNKLIPINVKDKLGNTFIPIEEASVSYPRHLAGLVKDTGMHEGPWATTHMKDGRAQLTAGAKSEMFDKYRNAPNAMVADNGVLYPINDPKVRARGADFSRSYPPEQQFAYTVGPNGGRNGSLRNIASMKRDSLPLGAKEDIAAMTKPEPSSRFVPGDRSSGQTHGPSLSPDAIVNSGQSQTQPHAHANAYATPEPTPAMPSRFANVDAGSVPAPNFSGGHNVQFQPNVTPADFAQGTRASQARSDLVNSRRNSNVSMDGNGV